MTTISTKGEMVISMTWQENSARTLRVSSKKSPRASSRKCSSLAFVRQHAIKRHEALQDFTQLFGNFVSSAESDKDDVKIQVEDALKSIFDGEDNEPILETSKRVKEKQVDLIEHGQRVFDDEVYNDRADLAEFADGTERNWEREAQARDDLAEVAAVADDPFQQFEKAVSKPKKSGEKSGKGSSSSFSKVEKTKAKADSQRQGQGRGFWCFDQATYDPHKF